MRNVLPLTKLCPEHSGDAIMARPPLLQRLCSVRNKRLALVVAPAGAGKTTLLCECFRQLAHEGILCAWLSLDHNECNPRRFAGHLALALQRVLPTAGRESLKHLNSLTTAPEAALDFLINDLAAARNHVALFIDNFEEVDKPEICSLLSYFLRYLPINVHLIIASQRNFSQPLSWVRGRDWAFDLNWNDLFLDPATIRSYLLEFRTLKLCETEISALTHNTEGWIGALRLAADTLDRLSKHTPEQRLNTLTNGHFALPLLDELLSRLPMELQLFLQETALPDRLCPPLCDTLLQSKNSHTFLNELEHTHCLLRRCNDEWLRYPELLAGFLRRRLQNTAPERFAILQHRVGDWYAAHGQHCQALRHWLTADETEAAAHLLRCEGKTMLPADNGCELQGWLECLPVGAVESSPELSILKAWCALIADQPLTVENSLREAQAARQACQEEDLECNILHSLAAICRYSWPHNTHLLDRQPETFDHTPPFLQTSVHLSFAHQLRYRDELTAAQTAYRNAAELAESHQQQSLHALAQQGLAAIDLLQARPDRALARIERYLSEDILSPNKTSHWQSLLHTLQAQALMDKSQDSEAKIILDEAIRKLESKPKSGHLGIALVLRATLQAEADNVDAAHSDLARARTLVLPQGISRVLFRADLCESILYLTGETPEEARSPLDRAFSILAESDQSAGENFEAWQIMQCAWLIALHRHLEARDLAQNGENSARSAGRWRHCIDFLLLRSTALANLPGNQNASRECIEQARQLSRTGGVRRPFQTLAPAIDLLVPHADYERPPPEAPLRLPDHLHQREAQILRLLELGLRNREIATRLFLSEETIKWYLKRLYGNFAVGNRVQLIAAVRKSGLLNDSPH